MKLGTSGSRQVETSRSRRGFTITEILIVIGVIVLMLALAVPAFNLITGGRSIEGATNQISAMLGRARAEAIGLQKPTGILFYVDPKSQRKTIAIVQATDAPAAAGQGPDVWLDVPDNKDVLPLPSGVSVQTMCDSVVSGADRYFGFNTVCTTTAGAQTATSTPFGGVILFDGNGQLTTQTYGFRCESSTTLASSLGHLLGFADGSNLDVYPGKPTSTATLIRSQFGLTLFEFDPFTTQGYKEDDVIVATGSSTTYTSSGEKAKELWLDSNASPILINRYNGTLVKSQ